jgi:fatty acid synthase
MSILTQFYAQLIPQPKPRSSRWVCSSVQPSTWNSPAVKYSSAEYHTNNLLNAVYFDEASHQIPHNAITIEIAPHGLLQAILKRSLNEGITNIALTQRGHPDGTEFLLTALGRCVYGFAYLMSYIWYVLYVEIKT